MTGRDSIPAPAVQRLSLYLRQLEALQFSGVGTVSSKQLGRSLGLSDAQVRKDLGYFGQFGHPGVGYRVDGLIQRVRGILGTDKVSNVVLVGAGNPGRALASFRGFSKKGFEVVGIFDSDSSLAGQPLAGLPTCVIQPMREMAVVVRTKSVRLGILAVPAPSAQTAAAEMVAAGLRGILNFAPISLQTDPSIAVSTVDLAVHLEQLSFQMTGSAG